MGGGGACIPHAPPPAYGPVQYARSTLISRSNRRLVKRKKLEELLSAKQKKRKLEKIVQELVKDVDDLCRQAEKKE